MSVTEGQARGARAQSGPEGRVQNIADNSSTPRKSGDFRDQSYVERYELLDFLRLHSVRRRQRFCMARAFGDEVRVISNADGRYGYSGLQTCGSVTCPSCGPRIAQHRREEITMGLDSWQRGHGGRILFGTLTLRHNARQSHAELADAIAKCWSRATGGRGWVDDRRSHGIEHVIRVWETTYGFENGWHVHVHFLLLVGPGFSEPDALLKSMFRRWRLAALALGLGEPLMKQGSDLHEVYGSDVAEQLGVYFAKQSAEQGRDTADAMGWEMAGGDGKLRGAGLAPGTLLRMAAAAGGKYLARWNEYELSMYKRRTIAWSRGSREDLGLDIELSDEEIAEKAELEALLEHIRMPSRVFRRIATTKGMRSELLDVVQVFGAIRAVMWLRDRGFEVYDDVQEDEV